MHQGIAYFVNRAGVCYGLNSTTGQEIFAKRLKGSTWATPIALGQQIFFFARDGQINILTAEASEPSLTFWNGLPEPPKAGPQETSSGNGRPGSMDYGPVLYAAAWCGDSFLLRRGTRLYRVAVGKH